MNDRKKRIYGYVDPDDIQESVHEETHLSTDEPKIRQWPTILLRLLKSLGYLLILPFRLFWKLFTLIFPTKKAFFARGFRLAIFLGVLGIIGGVGIAVWASKDLPDPDKLTDREIAQSTKIYDRTGAHLLYEIYADENRTLVTLEDIPDHVINGVIATEDTAFYEHHGIRPLSIIRSFATGRAGGGASTLTQQLVKNAILTSEKSITRKAKEAILSLQLERKYDKDQILQIYFNEIPYGSTNYGIQSAAQSYFGKDVQDLTLSESATLAGLPKAPTYYLNNTDALKVRRDFVLRRMYDEGFISEEEKNAAQAESLDIQRTYSNIKAPHFVLYVKQNLVEEFGEQLVASGGLKVITSLDWEIQQKAETAVTEESEKVFEQAGANNAALVAMDPKTGQIVAMVGSRDFYDDEIDGQFNVATLGRRQPGSSFKPMVYTAAFETGYTPETVLFDVKTNFSSSGDSYTPLNYDLKEHGPVTIRQSLQGSLNIPAVKALYLVGVDNTVTFAKRLGYSTFDADRAGLSLVLGGGEVNMLEHVNGYGVFANNGVRQDPTTILRVEDNTGKTLLENKPKRGEKILEPEIAATISHVLSDDAARAYAFGANGILTLGDRPVAAKTGTTNNYVDAWTLGYTPNLVAGVWAGNTNNSSMNRGFGGSRVAAPIWNRFMRDALQGTEVVSFPTPPPNDAEKPVLRGSQGGGITLKVDKVTGKLATTSTPEHFIVERTYIPPHSILHYVIKDDPRGPIPEDPTQDPQYEIWEAAIQDWIARNKAENPDWEVSFEEPPSEYDDAHSLELIPSLEIVYPAASSTINTRHIQTDIRVSAPRGVTQVTYRLDGRYVGVVREHPFNLDYTADWLENGPHELIVIVEDDVGNRLEHVVPFTLDTDSDVVTSLTWQTLPNTKFTRGTSPYSLILKPTNPSQMKEIYVNITAEGSTETTPVTTVDNPSSLPYGVIPISLEEQDVGRYTLTTNIVLHNGDVVSGDSVVIEIVE